MYLLDIYDYARISQYVYVCALKKMVDCENVVEILKHILVSKDSKILLNTYMQNALVI